MRGRFSTNNGGKTQIKNYVKLPKILYLAIMRKYFKKYPKLPWIPFSAMDRLNEIIKPNYKILEIGAGMSTIWLSERCKSITSIEANPTWFNELINEIKSKGILNIDLRHEWTAERMSNFDEFPDAHFDLIYIDGGPRGLCCQKAIAKIKKGGFIYLDNSDNEELCENGKQILYNSINNDPAFIETYIDFVPGNFMINEGTLIKY